MTEKNDLMLVVNDLGYGFIKSEINDEKIKIPSVIAKKQTYMAPNPDEISDEYMKDFLNRMDVSVNSASVERAGRFLVGEAASKGASRTQTFNIFSGQGKSDNDLSVILTLSVIAGERVRKAYENGEDLTRPLTANVIMATELPIAEGRNAKKSKDYEDKYLGHKHVVTFNNFADPITVTVNFLMVHSYLEGETASLALANAAHGLKGFPVLDDLKKEVMEDYRKHYPERSKKYGVEEVLEAQNVFVLDIGERTSDMVTTTDGGANPEASDSVSLGYGTALESARKEARIKDLGDFRSRYDMKNFLSRKLVGPSAEKQTAIQELVDEQLQNLSDGILDAASDILSLTANSTDAVYVLGGGSIPMAESSHLREDLEGLLTSLNAKAPIIWVGKKNAQWVNEIGLKLALKVMVNDAKKDDLID